MAATTVLKTRDEARHSNRLYWIWVGALAAACFVGLVAM